MVLSAALNIVLIHSRKTISSGYYSIVFLSPLFYFIYDSECAHLYSHHISYPFTSVSLKLPELHFNSYPHSCAMAVDSV